MLKRIWTSNAKNRSTDAAPIYLTYHHPDNLFDIDYPAHWRFEQEEDGAVEFSATEEGNLAGIMLFRVPLPIDTKQIEYAVARSFSTADFQQRFLGRLSRRLACADGHGTM